MGDWEFNRCPLTYVTENMQGWSISHKMYKKGFLPSSGGWLQQSNKFLLVMTFIDQELSKHENEMAVRDGRK